MTPYPCLAYKQRSPNIWGGTLTQCHGTMCRVGWNRVYRCSDCGRTALP